MFERSWKVKATGTGKEEHFSTHLGVPFSNWHGGRAKCSLWGWAIPVGSEGPRPPPALWITHAPKAMSAPLWFAVCPPPHPRLYKCREGTDSLLWILFDCIIRGCAFDPSLIAKLLNVPFMLHPPGGFHPHEVSHAGLQNERGEVPRVIFCPKVCGGYVGRERIVPKISMAY